jgi:hypothetical protein
VALLKPGMNLGVETFRWNVSRTKNKFYEKWKQEEGKYGIAKMEDDFCIVMVSIIIKMAIYPQIQQCRQYISSSPMLRKKT